jgi:predicted Zn-dependent protease
MNLFRNNPNFRQSYSGNNIRGGGLRLGAPIIIALVIAGFSYFRYCSTETYNEYLGINQHISLTPEQEIAIGLQSKPAMIQEYGGMDPDQRAQALVQETGASLVQNSVASKTPYQYQFHLLADPNTINAFALPGGQIFITRALFNQLQTKDQLAGVLGHEIGHVVARHAGERIEKDQLWQGIAGAAGIAMGDYQSAQAAQQIAALISLKYGRDQELQSDNLGVRFMMDAGFQPEELIGVMEILKKASGGQSREEFTSTHPDPENRKEKIKEAIEQYRQANKQNGQGQ